jgi:biopolymer transport protein ExbD
MAVRRTEHMAAIALAAAVAFVTVSCGERDHAQDAEVGDRLTRIEQRLTVIEQGLDDLRQQDTPQEPLRDTSPAQVARDALEKAKREAQAFDLPRAASGSETLETLVVVIDASGTVTVDGMGVARSDLGDRLRQARERVGDVSVIIQADQAVSYQDVIAAIDAAKQAGFSKFAMAVAPEAPAIEPP